jgi:hypothetical protein
MPLHDWRDDRGWDGVHLVWLARLLDWVQPRLPAGYRAYLGSVPALTIDTPDGRPDLSVRRWTPQPTAGSGPLRPQRQEAAPSRVHPDLPARIAGERDALRRFRVNWPETRRSPTRSKPKSRTPTPGASAAGDGWRRPTLCRSG